MTKNEMLAEQPAQQQCEPAEDEVCEKLDCPNHGAAQEPDETLLAFYQVNDYPSLVAAMGRHIKKMQSKLPVSPQTAIDAWNNREMMRDRTASKPLPFNEEDLAELDNGLIFAYKLGWRAAEKAHGITGD